MTERLRHLTALRRVALCCLLAVCCLLAACNATEDQTDDAEEASDSTSVATIQGAAGIGVSPDGIWEAGNDGAEAVWLPPDGESIAYGPVVAEGDAVLLTRDGAQRCRLITLAADSFAARWDVSTGAPCTDPAVGPDRVYLPSAAGTLRVFDRAGGSESEPHPLSSAPRSAPLDAGGGRLALATSSGVDIVHIHEPPTPGALTIPVPNLVIQGLFSAGPDHLAVWGETNGGWQIRLLNLPTSELLDTTIKLPGEPSSSPLWVPSASLIAGAGSNWLPSGAGSNWTPSGAGSNWTPAGAGSNWYPDQSWILGAGSNWLSAWTLDGEPLVSESPALDAHSTALGSDGLWYIAGTREGAGSNWAFGAGSNWVVAAFDLTALDANAPKPLTPVMEGPQLPAAPLRAPNIDCDGMLSLVVVDTSGTPTRFEQTTSAAGLLIGAWARPNGDATDRRQRVSPAACESPVCEDQACPCVLDDCSGLECLQVLAPTGWPCSDADLCTVGDACGSFGQCEPGPVVQSAGCETCANFAPQTNWTTDFVVGSGSFQAVAATANLSSGSQVATLADAGVSLLGQGPATGPPELLEWWAPEWVWGKELTAAAGRLWVRDTDARIFAWRPDEAEPAHVADYDRFAVGDQWLVGIGEAVDIVSVANGAFELLGSHTLPVAEVAIDGSRAWFGGPAGVSGMDISDPSVPSPLGTWPGLDVRALHHAGTHLWVGTDDGIVLLDTTTPAELTSLGSLSGGPVAGITTGPDGRAAVHFDDGSVRVATPSPLGWGAPVATQTVRGLAISADRLWAAAGDDGLSVAPLDAPADLLSPPDWSVRAPFHELSATSEYLFFLRGAGANSWYTRGLDDGSAELAPVEATVASRVWRFGDLVALGLPNGLEIRRLPSLATVAHIVVPGSAVAVATDGTSLAYGSSAGALQVARLDRLPLSPRLWTDNLGPIGGVGFVDTGVLVVSNSSVVLVDPAGAVTEVEGTTGALAVTNTAGGSLALAALGDSGAAVISEASAVATLSTGSRVVDVALRGRVGALIDISGQLTMVDLTDPDTPSTLWNQPLPGRGRHVIPHERGFAFTTDALGGHLLDLRCEP